MANVTQFSLSSRDHAPSPTTSIPSSTLPTFYTPSASMADLSPDIDPNLFLPISDTSADAHQVLNKLRGKYNYVCTTHHCDFEASENGKTHHKFSQEDTHHPIVGTVAIEPRCPAGEYTEVLITTSVQLHRKDGLTRDRTEKHVIRLYNDPKGGIFLLRPIPPEPGEVYDFERFDNLGKMALYISAVEGSGASARQYASLSLSRGEQDIDAVEDFLCPWRMLQISMYIGPGVSKYIAGKEPGFEIALKEPWWLYPEIYPNLWDWNMLRIEVCVPADEATRRKWGGTHDENDGTAMRRLTGTWNPKYESGEELKRPVRVDSLQSNSTTTASSSNTRCRSDGEEKIFRPDDADRSIFGPG